LPETPAPEPVSAEPAAGGPAEEAEPELVFVEVNRRRVLAATIFAPPVVLLVVMTALGLVVNRARLGLDLFGGKLLPVGGLGELWSSYLE
ncbi:hypothetical protein, partial [Amycolatopsis sp. SID8362]|uniref:hypothetical protein n=1 Tax=Amycolatopsis sp. SID8362 TaxID=2690346 RepID=UPI00137208CA